MKVTTWGGFTMNWSVLLIFTVFLVVGCVTQSSVPTQSYQPRRVIEETPNLGSIGQVELGNTLLSYSIIEAK